MQHLGRYDWVIFTSANGVCAFMDRLFHKGLDVRAFGHARLAVIGARPRPRPCGAIAWWRMWCRTPSRRRGSWKFWSQNCSAGPRLLLARAEQARDVLPDGLTGLGVKLDVVPVYRALAARVRCPGGRRIAPEGRVDLLTFTSSSTVHNFAGLVGQERFQELAAHATVASIGPITTATLSEYGITPQIEPTTFTIPALAAAIVDYLENENLGEGPGTRVLILVPKLRLGKIICVISVYVS